MYKEKIISIKIDQKLWKEVKLLALMPDKSIKALLEELLRRKLKVKMVNESLSISQNVLQTLDELRKKVKTPFIITTQKTAVELVCEGKGICSRTGLEVIGPNSIVLNFILSINGKVMEQFYIH